MVEILLLKAHVFLCDMTSAMMVDRSIDLYEVQAIRSDGYVGMAQRTSLHHNHVTSNVLYRPNRAFHAPVTSKTTKTSTFPDCVTVWCLVWAKCLLCAL